MEISLIALVQRLTEKDERKEFSDSMSRLWDEAKQKVKKLREEAKEMNRFGIPEEQVAVGTKTSRHKGK